MPVVIPLMPLLSLDEKLLPAKLESEVLLGGDERDGWFREICAADGMMIVSWQYGHFMVVLPGSGSRGAPQVGHLNARMDESDGILISSPGECILISIPETQGLAHSTEAVFEMKLEV